MQKSTASAYDVALLEADMTAKGWLPIDLARRAKVSHMSVGRFFRGEVQTARMAKKLAVALGHRLDRYLRPSESVPPEAHDSGAYAR